MDKVGRNVLFYTILGLDMVCLGLGLDMVCHGVVLVSVKVVNHSLSHSLSFLCFLHSNWFGLNAVQQHGISRM